MIVCQHCARPNPENARFCHRDGKPLPRPTPVGDVDAAPTWTPLVRELRPTAERRPAQLYPVAPLAEPLPPMAPLAAPVAPGRPAPRLRFGTAVGVALLTGLVGVGVALSLPAKSPPPSASIAAEPPPPAPQPSAPQPSAPQPGRVAARAPDDEPAVVTARMPPPPVLALAELRSAEVEVVFCLDTTGSMGGLLRAAKQKIWSLCNQIASGRPTPALRIGLVAYRDRGDEYVTRIVPLTRDLDSVYQELLLLKASGGGDTPESVNEALDHAVNRIDWSTDKKTLRIVFLVGDAPPHMDYPGDAKYPETCKKAAEKGILVNAVQCGSDAECARHWKAIASASGGEYVAIPQAGGVREVVTPFDDRLGELAGKLLDTALVFGTAEQKRAGERIVKAARALTGPAAADRAAFAARSKRLGPNDLVEAVASRRLRLEDVKVSELPAGFARLTTRQRKARLDESSALRARLQSEALELESKRSEYLKKRETKDGFDAQVLSVLRRQAKEHGIEYRLPPEAQAPGK